MKIKSILLPLIVFFSLLQPVSGNFRFWMAFKADSRNGLTNYDFGNFITTTALSDRQLIALFKRANRNYELYEQLRAEAVAPYLEKAIKQYAYSFVIQKVATSPEEIRIHGRRTFKIKESDFTERVFELEQKKLKEIIPEHSSIHEAREAMGKHLKEIGFPHREEQSNLGLYGEWFELQKKRLKESIRLEEVQKFEYLAALGYQREFSVRPTEIFDAYRDNRDLVISALSEKRLFTEEVNAILKQNPDFSPLISRIDYISPENTPVQELKVLSPLMYEEFVSDIEELYKDENLEETKRLIQSYLDLAIEFSQNDREEIKKKMEENRESFFENPNNFRGLMLNKVLEVSLALKDSSEKAELDRSQIENQLELVKNLFIQTLSQVSETKKWVQEDFVEQAYAEFNQSPNSELSTETFDLITWFFKFKIKQAVLNIRPIVKLSLINIDSAEGQDKVNRYLTQVKFESALKNYRENKIPNNLPYFEINLDGDTPLSGRDAWSEILTIFP